MRKLLTTLLLFSVLVTGMSLYAASPKSAAAQTANAHIKSVTAITEVFGEGQKITAAVVEYDKEIDSSKLLTSTFSVEGRTIAKVYANNAPAKAAQGINGKYAIIELSTADPNALVLNQTMGAKPPVADQNAGTPPANGTPNAQGGGGPGRMSITRNEVKLSVTQAGDITTTDGEKYAAASQAVASDKVINVGVDDFQQLEFNDPKYGKTLMYNLYVPKNYDKNKSYPMVLFMPDASATSTDHDRTLIQGLGAVIWATPSEQAKHESFVLAPQYTVQTVNDNSQATDELDITVDLINSLTGQYNIDKNRLYTTGQSGGCMMSIAMDIKYPDLFAASLLVAGQWDAAKVAPMANDKLWIIVSEGDQKAFPGMNAITTALEKEGAKVSRATWSGLSTPAEFAAEVSKMVAEDSNIKYTALQKGTVVPAGQTDDPGSNHINTWRIAYTIEGVRDWLFTQTKTPAATVSSNDPLQFPVDNYVEKTETVTTSTGTKEVTYRLYERIPYVANPVDADYQSMNVKVPVKVDGQDVDATNAPILFSNSVGGYMSSSVNGGMLAGPPPGGMPGTPPAGMPGNPPAGMGGPGGPGEDNGLSRNTDLALAAGYVVVQPGARGRDNQAKDGTYYGKAPAAIVDLKAAVRYLHYNDALMPGNANWIISTGVSAGGALSALLGASGNSPLYDAYFKEIGAANADDSIFASADFCPITDLDHADMAYEWEFGATPRNGELVDQTISQQLRNAFAEYQASLKLEGKNGFGAITADNYGDYLVKTYLIPAANKYLSVLTDEARKAYLAKNSWITWSDNSATFTFEDYVAHDGRMKGLPAFDAFDLSAGENSLFGNKTTNARHFTNFSLRQAGGDPAAEIDSDLTVLVNLMNPMYFIAQGCSGCAQHWWIRHGSSDSDTSLPIITNLATSLENQGKDVNTALYWDKGHGADDDPEAFIAWIGQITGYTQAEKSAHVKSVTAITEVSGAGQKVTATAIEYDQEIDTSKLTTSTFTVADRTITNVYANTTASKAAQGVNGKYVIIELSADDVNATTIKENKDSNAAAPMEGNPADTPPAGMPPSGPMGGMDATIVATVAVTQVADVITTGGAKYAASSTAMTNDKVINLIVDDFKQFEYTDPATGITLKYNLYIPKNYDKSKSYPLILFMHDASEVGNDTEMTLAQGLGAVIWATPSEQAKHESFVLAPEYATVIANDNSETTPDADATVNLIKYLETQYSIDPNRLYTTGQSMGCMTSMALLIKYPDMFAAAMLVAGQWDAGKVSPMANQKMWIIVSEGDQKAFPGMNAITAALEKEGAKVSRGVWSGLSTPAEFAAGVSKMTAENTNIKYTALQKGTVVPAGQTDGGGSNHINTWRIAYTIEGVRDWLFAQSKTTN